MNFYNTVQWNPQSYAKSNLYYAPQTVGGANNTPQSSGQDPSSSNIPKQDTAKQARFTLSNAYGSGRHPQGSGVGAQNHNMAPQPSSFIVGDQETPRSGGMMRESLNATIPINRVSNARSVSQERDRSGIQYYVQGPGGHIYPTSVSNPTVPLLSRSRINQIETTLQSVHQKMAEVPENPSNDNTTLIVSQVDQVLKILSQIEQKVTTTTNEKTTQADIWRNQYENQLAENAQIQSSYQQEIKGYHEEINRLNHTVNSLHIEQVRSAEQAQNVTLAASNLDIDDLQKSHANSVSLYEEQIRKLRQIVQDRQKEIAELNSQVNQHQNMGDLESSRLSQEKGKLMHRITNLELQQERNMELLKSQISTHYNDQISNLKNLHLNEIHVLQDEIMQLKKVLDLKNQEITTMIDQNQDQKSNYDNEVNSLREELSQLKRRIRELAAAKDQEIRQLIERLSAMHNAELQNLKIFHQNQIDSLCSENEKLKAIIRDKNIEIDNQTREQIQQASIYKDEKTRLQADLQKIQVRIVGLQRQHESQLFEAQARFNRTLLESNQHIRQQTDHIKYLEEQINNLQSLISHKNGEYEKLAADKQSLKVSLQAQITSLKQEMNTMVQRYESHISELNLIGDQLKHKLNLLENNSFQKIRDLENTISILQLDLAQVQDTLELKQHENNDLTIHKHQLEERLKRQEKEIDNLRQQIIHIDRSQAVQLEEIRVQIENTNSKTLDAMRKTHSNQIQVLIEEKDALQINLEKKSRDVSDLLARYDQLVAAYTNGEPLSSDLNATQAIFQAAAKSHSSQQY